MCKKFIVMVIMVLLLSGVSLILLHQYNLVKEENHNLYVKLSKMDDLNYSLRKCNRDLIIYNISLVEYQKRYTTCSHDLVLCEKNISYLKSIIENFSCNCSCLDCNVSVNYTKYDFGCYDWSGNNVNEITKYRCVWDLRQLDGLGSFYDPMVACQDKIGHWWLHCKCAEQIPIYGGG